jgi:hypothetical protein
MVNIILYWAMAAFAKSASKMVFGAKNEFNSAT